MYDYEKDHLARVRAGLAECMVLLKKDGAFPLNNPCRIAAYGSGVRHSITGGTGSGEVNSHVIVNIEEGLIEAGFDLASRDWLDQYDEVRAEAKKAFRKKIKQEARAAGQNAIIYAMGAVMPEPEYDLPLDFDAEAAIYVIARISGEGSDRRPVKGDVFLTDAEIRDIRALDERYDKFMLVLNTGGPVDLSPVQDVANILVLSQLGSQMGPALADVLLGRETPSGKLTTTWAAWSDYCPQIHFGYNDDTEYREGIYVGYRYFDTVGKRAMFPFGYGLSYTTFSLSNMQASLDASAVTVSADIGNKGLFTGKEVLQVYVTAPEGSLKKPWQSLTGFAKTCSLRHLETQTVKISFDMTDLVSFDEERSLYCLEPGEYIIRAGTSSVDTRPIAVIDLGQEIITKKVRAVVAKTDIRESSFERAAREETTDELPRLVLDPACIQTETVAYETAEADPTDLTDEELAYLAVGHFSEKKGLGSVIGAASTHVAGAAGETTSKLSGKDLKPVIMADGPAGLRLAKDYYQDETGAHALGSGMLPTGMLDMLSAPARIAVSAVTGSKKPPKKVKAKHQYCTSLPIGTALAQSWNIHYAQVLGDLVGSEMELFGVHLWLAPALNIHRSILCGRNFEYYSEDPLVSGKFAAAVTRGVQSHPGRGTTIKHFTANNQERNRYYNNSHVSERALREIYMKGFEICIREAQPLALMTSYNLVNGTHTSEMRSLIEDFLRAECGFEGIVTTDWVFDMKNLGRKYAKARANRVAAAGGDLFMPGSKTDYEHVLTALKTGMLTRKQLEKNAQRVIRLAENAQKEV